MFDDTRFNVLTIILLIVIGIVLFVGIHNGQSFRYRINYAYQLFTNRSYNKSLEYNVHDKTWTLVADERTVYSGMTNRIYYTVGFSEREHNVLMRSNQDFVFNTVACIVNGDFTNEWKLSVPIVLHLEGKSTNE